MSASVLPARAGMSPSLLVDADALQGAPRTGGDEPPHQALAGDVFLCSPHGRG